MTSIADDDLVAPGADLRGVRLVDADLSGRDLRGCVFDGADLARADLSGAKLTGASLVDCDLTGARLDRAQIVGVDATRARFTDASLRATQLGSATLDGALFFGADLTEASLSSASMVGVDLRNATLHGARLLDVVLNDADCTQAVFTGADLTGADVRGSSFRDVELSGGRLRRITGTDAADWIGVDVLDVDFAGAYLARRTIMDQNYLHEFRSRSDWHERLYRLWWLTSDCGRSFVRWGILTVMFAVVFGFAYGLVDVDYGSDETALSPWYFSVVTLTTLGYGDALPASLGAQVMVMTEVVLGYVMLGGLLSIFATKMGRRAE